MLDIIYVDTDDVEDEDSKGELVAIMMKKRELEKKAQALVEWQEDEQKHQQKEGKHKLHREDSLGQVVHVLLVLRLRNMVSLQLVLGAGLLGDWKELKRGPEVE